MRARALVLLGLVSALALTNGCGAKTGLLVPDDADDVTVRDSTVDADVADVPLLCRAGQYGLTARAADVLFVVDRSGSMAFGLANDMRPVNASSSRWALLQQALGDTLPMFADRINVGALFYPETDASAAASCALPNIPSIDVEPAPNNAPRVLSVMQSTRPGGSTPTYAALLRAYTWFVRHPNRARARYLVLTTDGAPNCNAALDSTTCACTTNGRVGGCGRNAANSCLDDARTVDIIHQIATNPATAVPTYVIGIAPDADPLLGTALTAMAIAGGRPRRLPDGTQTFYSVRQTGELASALTEIQGSIARCAFVTPSRPDSPDGISITLNGMNVQRDTTRASGWDWTDEGFGEITLFGDACAEALRTRASPVAQVGCNDR